MPSFRTYKTNLDYTASEDSLRKNYSIADMPKGNVTLHLPAFPDNAVQITSHGFVKIHGSTAENDGQILKILAADMKTVDSQEFSWKLPKKTKGEKELRKDLEELLKGLDLEAQRRLFKLFLDRLDDEVKSFDIGSSYDEVKVGRELLTTIRPKVDSMDSELISQSLLEV